MDPPLDSAQKRILVIDATKREIIRGLLILLIVILVFLFMRILLKLLGAQESLFLDMVNGISGLFLLPFFGMFSEPHTPGQSSFDGVALLAFFSYLVLIPVAMGITHITAGMLKTQKKVKETVKKNHPVEENKELIQKVTT